MSRAEKETSRDNAGAKESFRKLSFGGKVSHILHYYKWFLLFAVFIAIAVVTLTRDVRTNLKEEPYLRVILVDGNEAACGRTAIFREFAEAFGEKETDSVYVESALKGGDAASLQILSSRIAGGEADVIVLPEDLYREYGARGAFAPLTDILPKEYLSTRENAAAAVTDSLSGEEIECGFFIDGGRLWDELIYPEESKSVIAVCSVSERKETAAEFLKYLLP